MDHKTTPQLSHQTAVGTLYSRITDLHCGTYCLLAIQQQVMVGREGERDSTAYDLKSAHFRKAIRSRVAQAFNPSTQEAEAGGISEFKAGLAYRAI